MAPPVDLVDLKLHLQIDPANTDNDTEMTAHLEAATVALEGLVGPMVPQTITSRRRAVNGAITLPVRPVLDVLSVAGAFGAVDQDVAGLDWDTNGVIRGGLTCLPSGRYTVTWTAGRDPVPENMRLAVLIVAAHLWETQRNRGARRAVLGDFDSGNPSQDAILLTRGFALPRRALELLQTEDPGLVVA